MVGAMLLGHSVAVLSVSAFEAEVSCECLQLSSQVWIQSLITESKAKIKL